MSAIISSGSRVWALVFAIAVWGFSHPVAANVLQDNLSEPKAATVDRTAEPFGLFTSALPEGPLPAKWRDVEQSLEAERQTLADCRTSPDTCMSLPAIQFLKIVSAANGRAGLARLGQINRAFNLAIRPVSDRAQYGVEDRWTSPLVTLAAGAGDCEDYAIAKLVALREAGVAQEDLRMIIVRETGIVGEDHAVAAARVDGHWYILDNRTMIMVEDNNLVRFRPLFAIDASGAKRFETQQVAAARITPKAETAQLTTAPIEFKADVVASVITPDAASDATGDLWATQIM